MAGTRTGKAARQHASAQGLHPSGVHAPGWPWRTWLPIIIAVALGVAHEASPRAKERPHVIRARRTHPRPHPPA